MEREGYFLLGYIIKPHGHQGHLLCEFDADIPEFFFQGLKTVFINMDGPEVPFFIEQLSLVKADYHFIKLQDIDDKEQAVSFSGKQLWLPVGMLPPSFERKGMDLDKVIGFEVHEQGGGPVGKVERIMSLRAQTLLIVLHQGREVMIPAVDEIIKKIDNVNRKIEVDLPEGLLDI